MMMMKKVNEWLFLCFCHFVCLNIEVSAVVEERENKATLTREVSIIKERLRVVEADSGFLKHAAKTMQIGDEGAKLLKEIAEHLRALRQKSLPSKTDA